MGRRSSRAAAAAVAAATIRAAPRSEWPFLSLVALSLLAPVAVLAQDGGWPLALLSCPAVLAVPGAAIEMMLGLARAALWLEGGGLR
jgi:hypothetical protein